MPLDDDFRALLLAELPELSRVDASVADIVDGGIAAGYRIRRHRRNSRFGQATVAGIVVAAGVIGLVIVAHRPDGRGRISAAQAPATGVTLIDGIPSGVRRPVTESGVKAALTTLLSRTGKVVSITTDTSPSGLIGASAQYDDGLGLAAVSVEVSTPRPIGQPPAPSADFGKNSACTTINAKYCTQSTLVDGSRLMSFRNDPSAPPGGELSASHGRLDGSIVEVSEWNGAKFKSPTPTRAQQAFTTDQLIAFAESPLF